MAETNSMQHKRVLVTGSGTGIGSGIAREFAAAGADVAVHCSRSKEGAEALVEELTTEYGCKSAVFQADLSRLDAVERLASESCQFLGGLDVLVNNAGITFNMPFGKITPEQFDKVYHVNVRGGFFLLQHCLPHLEKSQGSVINITSIHAYEGMPEHSVYAGTKGAIVASTRALAIELAMKGVRVNGIAPGCVPVDNYTPAVGEYDAEEIGNVIPAGYVGTPSDIGRATLFLASDASRFIVGQTLVIDGGTTSWLPFNDSFRQAPSSSGVQFGKGYVPGI